MKSEKKLKREFQSIEKKFSIDPSLLAKANKFASCSYEKQMEYLTRFGQEMIQTKYKKHKIAERTLLSALDEIQIEYLSKHRKIMVSAQEVIKKIKNQQREIQIALESLKQRQLDKIEPQIQKFMSQRKLLKKIKSTKNIGARKIDKFIDGHEIAEKVREFKGTLQKFDLKIDSFCQKMKKIQIQLNANRKTDSKDKIISLTDGCSQTADEFIYNPDSQESFQRKMKQIRSIFHQRKSRQKLEDRIQVNHAHNISIQQIFQKDNESQQYKFERSHRNFGQEKDNLVQAAQLNSKSSLPSQIAKKQIENRKQCQEDLQIIFRQQMEKHKKNNRNDRDEDSNQMQFKAKTKIRQIYFEAVYQNQQQESIYACKKMKSTEKDNLKVEPIKGLKSVRSEQSLLGNTSVLSQKSISSRPNCLEVLRLQKMKYEEIKSSLIK